MCLHYMQSCSPVSMICREQKDAGLMMRSMSLPCRQGKGSVGTGAGAKRKSREAVGNRIRKKAEEKLLC